MAKDFSAHSSGQIAHGRYTARFADSVVDVIRTQKLRHRCFIEAAGLPARPDALERDQFDAACEHGMVEDEGGTLVCSFRVMALASGADLGRSYSAQSYDLAQLTGRTDPLIELGRFCVAPQVADPDVLRLAWGVLARYVDTCGAGLLFGCSSFQGTDPAAYAHGFSVLAARHVGPVPIGVAAADVVRLGGGDSADLRAGLAQLPPLLRSYLSMGGWVSDHAVIDHQMNTLHVFTGLEIADIPPRRARALRALAG